MPRGKAYTIEGQFIPHRRDMLASPAFLSLNLAARRVLDRLEIEHMDHGGNENGRLACTYADFEAFGIRRKSIAQAIEDLIGAGLVCVTEQGRGGNAAYRRASRYRLTYLGTPNGRGGTDAATDEWRRVRVAEDVSLRDIDSRGENAPGAVGAKTPPKTVPVGGENAPETRAKTPPVK